MLADNANIQIGNNKPGFIANDVLFISDCETVDIFRANNVSTDSGTGKVTIAHSNSVNTSNKLSKPYGTDATVYSFEHNVYYVGNSGRTNSRGQPIYALYKRDIKGNIQELAEGVENMQIVYGERLSNGSVRYVPADTTGLDKTKIISVRIALLMHSIDPVNSQADNVTYNLVGTSVFPSGGGTVTHAIDKRLRRVFVSTIKLRNRR
jgi:type IV pilus assembly protein PilW